MSDEPTTAPTGRALVVGLTHIDENVYGTDGRSGCYGCANDAAVISEALNTEGFKVKSLLNENATAGNILAEIQRASQETRPGDTFFFFFAGHGGQKWNEEFEVGEPDGKDETLVCFDREIIDDELKLLWDKFVAGSVIYMVGDSCNSGTQARFFGTQGDTLKNPLPLEYQSPYRMGSRENDWPELKATMLHMGGCRDGFTSMGEADGGVFTKALAHFWQNGHGKQTWRSLFDAAVDTITTQDPKLNTYGVNSSRLENARPFTPFHESMLLPTAEDPYDRDIATRMIGAEIEDLVSDDDAADRESLLRSGVLRPEPGDEISGTRGSAPRGLPISESQARRATRWLMENFGPELDAARFRKDKELPFGPEVLCAMACQETAYFWLPMWEKLKDKPEYQDTPGDLIDLIVARCVLDASGDYPGTSRSAFPRNARAFREHYGSEFLSMLVNEANETRALRGYSAKNYLYKGYGIFQYDLQFVKTDEGFFRDREWYDFSNCLDRCMGELDYIFGRTKDKWESVYRYNGRGSRARRYCENVKTFSKWAADEIANMNEEGLLDLSSNTRSFRGERNRRGIKPNSSPQLKKEKLENYLQVIPYAEIDRIKHPLIIVGIRGYYLDSMGDPGENERGIYDDAIFVLSEYGFASYNGNTDPSRYRKGSGYGKKKGMAKLKKGVWKSYKFDTHYGSNPHPAICQRVAEVTVSRDGHGGSYDHSGFHGINIHRGGYNGTSSLGCQTIYPTQWASFYNFAKDLAKRHHGDKWDEVTIPYVLLDEEDIRRIPSMT